MSTTKPIGRIHPSDTKLMPYMLMEELGKGPGVLCSATFCTVHGINDDEKRRREAFIVRACNSHETLVEIATEFLAACEGEDDGGGLNAAWAIKIRAALKLAKGAASAAQGEA